MSNETKEDLKQQIFKLQTDYEFKQWDLANKDLSFLSEIRDRLNKSRSDPSQFDYAMNMIDDWLRELNKIVKSEK